MTTYRGGKTGAVKSAGGLLSEPLSCVPGFRPSMRISLGQENALHPAFALGREDVVLRPRPLKSVLAVGTATFTRRDRRAPGRRAGRQAVRHDPRMARGWARP
jgi:hypothetical protein